jgi:hypothetical protein
MLLVEGLGDGAYPDVSDPLALGRYICRRLLHKCGQLVVTWPDSPGKHRSIESESADAT